MSKVLIVGIAGGTASGKTTILNKLKAAFADNIEILSHDCYYRAHDDMTYEERTHLNYDHPESFETDRMIEDVIQLKNGQPIMRPVYDFTVHNRAKETVCVVPKPVIIVEGILVLADPRLRELMDVKIFVDEDADERLMRRIIRDMAERGRSVESVLSQYRNTVKPMHEQFIEPSKKYADIIIPRGGENKPALNILTDHLRNVLKAHQEEEA